jgi:hypothetical protein
VFGEVHLNVVALRADDDVELVLVHAETPDRERDCTKVLYRARAARARGECYRVTGCYRLKNGPVTLFDRRNVPVLKGLGAERVRGYRVTGPAALSPILLSILLSISLAFLFLRK